VLFVSFPLSWAWNQVLCSQRSTTLERAIKTREDVLAIVSHDLKNPLTNTQLVTQLMQGMEQIDTKRVQEFVNKVQRSTDMP
jgi:signal transduction histidine kinase